MNNFMNLLTKIFDNFPFRILISCAIAGITYALTPNSNALLLKFGNGWYIAFIALIAFLILSLIIWVNNLIRVHFVKRKDLLNKLNYGERELEENLKLVKEKLFEITDNYNDNDIELLKMFVKNNNQIYKVNPFDLSSEFLNSSMVKRRIISKNEHDKYSMNRETEYIMEENWYNLAKIVYEKFGKVSNFDREKKF